MPSKLVISNSKGNFLERFGDQFETDKEAYVACLVYLQAVQSNKKEIVVGRFPDRKAGYTQEGDYMVPPK